jgi:hypothetical protein
MQRFRKVFGTEKPAIGMVHRGALSGTPLHDGTTGLECPILSVMPLDSLVDDFAVGMRMVAAPDEIAPVQA